jgi:hypothetical protein
MAARAKQVSNQFVEWAMPIKYMDGIREFLDPLYKEILKGAIARAQARGGAPLARVTADDVMESVRVIVPAALAKFEKRLKPSGVDHAKKKAS